ncbi:MAG: FG-GAP-like repeat-containing protein, partial [Marinirhabdus sp.]
QRATFSNGAVYADLDNDGDLDLVANNVNETATVLQNRTNTKSNPASFLKIAFKGSPKNKFGIGAKVILYAGTSVISKENFTTRGYLSAVAPQLHFGTGPRKQIDSVRIIWPDKKYETLTAIKTNKTLTVSHANAKGDHYAGFKKEPFQFLTEVPPPFHFTHSENATLAFNRDPLIPFAQGNEGPSFSVADVNSDGLDDLFVGGAKGQAPQLFIQQKKGGFTSVQKELFKQGTLAEAVASVFFDADNDGDNDLVVAHGGGEFTSGKPLRPVLYINSLGVFKKDTLQFKNTYINASAVKAVDFDNNGTPDLCITSAGLPQQFGHSPQQFIFKNDGAGNFTNVTKTVAPQLQTIGNVTDIVWTDLNGDNFKDAIAVGLWMPVTVFINQNGVLARAKNTDLEKTNGWWKSIHAADFDNDGDTDLVAGNWGLNTRLTASEDKPITLYRADFNGNGSKESLVTYHYQGTETPIASKDELAKQLPFINKKYVSYAKFARAALTEVFGTGALENSYKKQLFQLASCYFENTGGNRFKMKPLPFAAQVSSVNAVHVGDFDNDGRPDLLLAGNNFEISTQLSSLGASRGTLLLNAAGGFRPARGQKFSFKGAVRGLAVLKINGSMHLVVLRNNDAPQFFKMNKPAPQQ